MDFYEISLFTITYDIIPTSIMRICFLQAFVQVDTTRQIAWILRFYFSCIFAFQSL